LTTTDLRTRGHDQLDLHVAGGNEALPLQDVELGSLRKAGGLLRRDDVRDPADRHGPRRRAHRPEKRPPIESHHAAWLLCHGTLPAHGPFTTPGPAEATPRPAHPRPSRTKRRR